MTYPTIPQDPNGASPPEETNLQKLATLFPSAVKDGQLDLDALKEELGDFSEIQPGDERYELSWAGKQAAKKKAYEPLLGKTLKPLEDGVNAETSENLYIEGDNLEALKLLRTNYYGEVKMIYIDPPYNTGKDFVYTDKFATTRAESDVEEGATSEDGERLQKNEKSSNRFHAKWLDMMYPRLKLAKDLLREDGVIFISIDDNEVANLKQICDEVFGETNSLAEAPTKFIWKLAGSTSGHMRMQHEYIVCYTKNKKMLNYFKTNSYDISDELSDRAIKKVSPANPSSSIKFPAGLRCELENAEFNGEIGEKEKQTFSEKVTVNNYRTIGPVEISAGWGMKDQIEKWLVDKDNVYDSKGQKVLDFYLNKKGIVRYIKERGTFHPASIIDRSEIPKKSGNQGLMTLLGLDKLPFDYSKPCELLHYLISFTSTNNSKILDFFSGSSTTAHAVMKLNAEDGGTRKHIMVQLPEVTDEKSEARKAGYETIAEIGKERIRRAGAKILKELEDELTSVKDELEKQEEELKAVEAELTQKSTDKLNKKKSTLETEIEKAPLKIKNLQERISTLDIGFKSFRIEDTKINWLKKDLAGEELDPAALEMSNKDKLDFVPGFTDSDIVYEVMLRQSNIPLTHQITPPIADHARTYLYGESYLICLEETVTKELVESLAALEPTPVKYIFRDSAFGEDIALKDETFRRLNAEIEKNTDGREAYTVEFI